MRSIAACIELCKGRPGVSDGKCVCAACSSPPTILCTAAHRIRTAVRFPVGADACEIVGPLTISVV